MSARVTADTADGGLTREGIAAALGRVEGGPIEVVWIGSIADDRAEGELKHIGYGEPLLVRYRDASGVEERCVFHTMASNWFGHDRRSDRAALVLLAADTFAAVPRHTRVLDVGAVDRSGELVSLADAGEFYLLTSYAEGALYAQDLRRIEATGVATEGDVARARALAAYLAELHREPVDGPKQLYHRAVRDLLGSGEGIFGIADSYPEDGPIAPARLAGIERRCVDFRWRLRGREARLRRTHGDFHPYNVLFREGTDFTMLDASRGGVGEPADDLAAMAINFVFGAVVYPASWRAGIAPLWRAFWSTYLEAIGDRGALEVIAPFFAWRALVVACPVWYPGISREARDGLLRFAEEALDAAAFDPDAAAFAPK